MGEFTKGEWKTAEYTDSNIGLCQCVTCGGIIICLTGGNNVIEQANAHLISAAPDLLAACEDGGSTQNEKFVDILRKAAEALDNLDKISMAKLIKQLREKANRIEQAITKAKGA